MNPAERFRKVESLYYAALERPIDERPAFLRAACPGDDGLRRDVESLLSEDGKAQTVISTPAIPAAQQMATDNSGAPLAGHRFGAYQIVSLIGAGGMGRVYRARDTRLGRDVAIKVLPTAFTSDVDRVARFEREARLLAALNHPNIATIHEVEHVDGIQAIVLELIDGETLSERLERGPLLLRDALRYAAALADALDAAHEKGIVHRDLKPGNIKITSADTVKVLDFGLAKELRDARRTDDVALSATTTIGGTEEGTIIGTAAYMSPEQARGKAIDKRGDIWAFGCVLYEMLSAKQAFGGKTVPDVLVAVLEHEPDFGRLPSTIPSNVRSLIRHCLQKDPRRRLRDIGDARLTLEAENVLAAPSQRSPAKSVVRALPWVLAGVLLATTLAQLTNNAPPVNFQAPLTLGPMTRLTWDTGLTTDPTISADGRLVAYASDRGGQNNLDIWVQQTSGGRPIQLTKDASDDSEPSLSPDGSTLVFRSERGGGGLYVVPALGGDARPIAPNGRGPKFSPDGRSIAFWAGGWLAARATGARRQTYVIPAAGGEPVPVLSNLANAGDPVWSPDGKSLLVFGRRATGGADTDADWWWVPLGGGAAVKSGAYERMRAVGILTPPPGGSNYPYPQAWTEAGVWFSATTGSADARHIWTLSIDPQTGHTVGDPRRMTAGTAWATTPAVSRDGRLVFSDVTERVQLLGLPLDANGGRKTGEPKPLRSDAARVGTRASATLDGSRLVFGMMGFVSSEVWIKNLQTNVETQLTATALASINPYISPTGNAVAYTAIADEQGASAGFGTGFVIDTRGGAPQKVCDQCEIAGFTDDRHVLIEAKQNNTWLLDVKTLNRAEVAAVTNNDIRVSWDQRWISFIKDDAINVAPFTPGRPLEDAKEVAVIVKRSTNAERGTGWSPDNRILYLLLEGDGHRCLYAVRIDPESGRPQGNVFAVHHFHSGRWRWGSTSRASAVVTGLFISGQYELTGNVWMTTLNSERKKE